MNEVTSYKSKILRGECIHKVDALRLADANLKDLCSAANEIRERLCGTTFDLCSIINAKSGRCSENCKYCSQSACYHTQISSYPLLDTKQILEKAVHDNTQGVVRFSLVTSGRKLNEEEVDKMCKTVRTIKHKTHLEICVSGGLLTESSFKKLKEVGVSRVHNNLETSERNFPNVCTTHTYQDKISTLKAAQRIGLSVCCGGIVGLGESMEDRIDMFLSIRELNVQSVPVNLLNPILGTPYAHNKILTNDEMCRIIAIARFLLPKASIRMAGGRRLLPDNGRQCFLSGANAAVSGDMLTTCGTAIEQDVKMLTELGFTIALHNV
ncbi:MAG: biotin synthase BioB [Puniceicoccales bacterium]|jgi:biotin synthase|nr:biotin synthase BioB [Puniceicoccales bacterium]